MLQNFTIFNKNCQFFTKFVRILTNFDQRHPFRRPWFFTLPKSTRRRDVGWRNLTSCTLFVHPFYTKITYDSTLVYTHVQLCTSDGKSVGAKCPRNVTKKHKKTHQKNHANVLIYPLITMWKNRKIINFWPFWHVCTHCADHPDKRDVHRRRDWHTNSVKTFVQKLAFFAI